MLYINCTGIHGGPIVHLTFNHAGVTGAVVAMATEFMQCGCDSQKEGGVS